MTTWNNTAPAVGNQISADIPDITENFAHLKSGFVRIFKDTWSDSDLTDDKIDTAVGFNDGTYNYEFPTNGVGAHSVIMLGTSDTIVWMYLNAAPPGWKVLDTGKDTVLAVFADSGDYAVEGGNADSSATWTIAGLTKDAHTHTVDIWASNKTGTVLTEGSTSRTRIVSFDTNAWTSTNTSSTTGAGKRETSAAQSDAAVSSDGSWRPSASVGKLFQLDTA